MIGGMPAFSTLHDAQREFRRRYVTAVLRASGGNRTRASATLGLCRTGLQRIIRDLGVDVPGQRGGCRSAKVD